MFPISSLRANGRNPERLFAASSGVEFSNPFERLTPTTASLLPRTSLLFPVTAC